jgi:hypothetical protein
MWGWGNVRKEDLILEDSIHGEMNIRHARVKQTFQSPLQNMVKAHRVRDGSESGGDRNAPASSVPHLHASRFASRFIQVVESHDW